MKLLSMVTAVEEWLASERTELSVDAAACLHGRDKSATCDRCVRACPVDALELVGSRQKAVSSGGAEIVLDAEKCVQCGLCLHVCPVGAFSGDDGAADLLGAVARLPKRHIVELACAAHPLAEKGPSQSSAVLRTKGCLAALGTATTLSLFALGVEHLVMRLDACATCPLGKVKTEIEANTLRACQLADDGADGGQQASLVEAIHDEWPERQVTAVNQPTRSRREFFKSLTAVDEPPALVQELIANDPSSEGKQPPQERRRLLAAWLSLTSGKEPQISPALLEALSFAEITADSSCTACGVCDRICPTDALQLAVDESDSYELTFTAANCVDCQLCLEHCEPGALQRHAPTSATSLLAEKSVVLLQGTLQRCSRCGAGFAGEATNELCSVCEFRRKQPFGSYLVTRERPKLFDTNRKV